VRTRALDVRENARGERGGFVPWDLGKRVRRVGEGREEEEAAFARASEQLKLCERGKQERALFI